MLTQNAVLVQEILFEQGLFSPFFLHYTLQTDGSVLLKNAKGYSSCNAEVISSDSDKIILDKQGERA